MSRIQLTQFLMLHQEITMHQTFTTKKRDALSAMWKYIGRKEKTLITARRNSRSCKVRYTHHFTLFQVRQDQLGNMMQFRGQWVVMWCYRIWAYDIYLAVLPLKKGDYSDHILELNQTHEKFQIVEP